MNPSNHPLNFLFSSEHQSLFGVHTNVSRHQLYRSSPYPSSLYYFNVWCIQVCFQQSACISIKSNRQNMELQIQLVISLWISHWENIQMINAFWQMNSVFCECRSLWSQPLHSLSLSLFLTHTLFLSRSLAQSEHLYICIYGFVCMTFCLFVLICIESEYYHCWCCCWIFQQPSMLLVYRNWCILYS